MIFKYQCLNIFLIEKTLFDLITFFMSLGIQDRKLFMVSSDKLSYLSRYSAYPPLMMNMGCWLIFLACAIEIQ